jgi:hypothetical protein
MTLDVGARRKVVSATAAIRMQLTDYQSSEMLLAGRAIEQSQLASVTHSGVMPANGEVGARIMRKIFGAHAAPSIRPW